MPIKAVFSDMDGTLFGAESKVSAYTIEVLKKLKARGVPLILATGRPYLAVLHCVKQSGISPDYIICTNGAIVMDKDGKVVAEHLLAPDVARKLMSVTQQPNEDGIIDASCPPKKFTTNVFSCPEWFTDVYIEEAVEAFDNSVIAQEVDFSKEGGRISHHVETVWFAADENHYAENLQKYIAKNYAADTSTALSLPYLCDVQAPNVNKGRAITDLCELLKIPVSDVAAFGDGMNDVNMLQTVGHPFVMQNAQDKLKATVPHAPVIGLNTEDGFAKQVEKLFNL